MPKKGVLLLNLIGYKALLAACGSTEVARRHHIGNNGHSSYLSNSPLLIGRTIHLRRSHGCCLAFITIRALCYCWLVIVSMAQKPSLYIRHAKLLRVSAHEVDVVVLTLEASLSAGVWLVDLII